MIEAPPGATLSSVGGSVASPDLAASRAGAAMLEAGGSAVDAAIAAAAVLSVTFQHACGLGGDLFAVLRTSDGVVQAIDGSGRAGSGADPERLRRAGHVVMPAHGDIAAVPLPGAVDGLLALHREAGTLPLAEILAPAIAYASDGFPASASLAAAVSSVAASPVAADYLEHGPIQPGSVICRPGVARALRGIAAEGRAGFYGGEFGAELLSLYPEEFSEEDLESPMARVVPPLQIPALGHRLFTAPPPSQGYLSLAAAFIADGLQAGAEIDSGLLAHLLVESARIAAFDRDDVLYDGADGGFLLDRERLATRRALIDPQRALGLPDATRPGGTVAVVSVGAAGDAVSMLFSNASGFGSGLGLPGLRIFLHNRGLGFSLTAGHPAEYGPGRRPPHTLSPLLVTTDQGPGETGALRAVLATMGGDSQPQILLQLAWRLFCAGEEPGVAVTGGRFALGRRHEPHGQSRPAGFDTWSQHGEVAVELEAEVPPSWEEGLSSRGHPVTKLSPGARGFGHAQIILVAPDASLKSASDPRSPCGGVAAVTAE